MMWALAVAGLVILGVAAVYVFDHTESPSSVDREANQYEIIE